MKTGTGWMRLALASVIGLATSVAPVAVAAAKDHQCEVKKDGKTSVLSDVGSRKDCKKRGGKWAKVKGAAPTSGAATGTASGGGKAPAEPVSPSDPEEGSGVVDDEGAEN